MEDRFGFRETVVHGTTGDSTAERLFASEDGRVAPLSDQECLFVLKRSGSAHVLTLQVLQALDQCREFRRLDEHVAQIEGTVAGLEGRHAEIRRVLENLVQRGVLASDAEVIARASRAHPIQPAPLRAVFIRACDRPDRLAGLLASLAEVERAHGARRRHVLVDDSTLSIHRAAHRDLLRQFARSTGCDTRYVGDTDMDALARDLGASADERTAAARLLQRSAQPQAHRFGGGRARNVALLLSAGARLALLDDDLRLPLRRCEFARGGLDPDPVAFASTRFFADMASALAQGGTPIDTDPFAMHLDACGHTLAAVIASQHGLRPDLLRGLNLGELHLLRGDSRIVSTHHGSVGSSRSESTLWLYHALDPTGREQFWRDREHYTRNRGAHHLVHGASRAHLVAVPGYTAFALDNAVLLPCTNAVGRAEDSLAAAITRHCHPDGVSLELPVVIGHEQESLRRRFDDTQAARLPRVNDFLRDLVLQQADVGHAAAPAGRLQQLAQVFRDLASAPLRRRIDHLVDFRRFDHASVVHRLQLQLDGTAAAPAYWQADVRAIVQQHARAMLASDASPRLAEWNDDPDAEQCAQALCQELDAMAEACEVWPALWARAAAMAEDCLPAAE